MKNSCIGYFSLQIFTFSYFFPNYLNILKLKTEILHKLRRYEEELHLQF